MFRQTEPEVRKFWSFSERSDEGIQQNVYVYNGYGISEESRDMLYHFLNVFVDKHKFKIEYITPERIVKGDWASNCALMAIGGGFDKGFVEALGQQGTRCIKEYVENGGSYLGICAGGYFGCSRIEFDKDGPLEVCEDRHLKFFSGLCVGPVYEGFQYNSESGSKAADILLECPGVADALELSVYFNGGGYFVLDEQASNSGGDSCDVLAYYREESRQAVGKLKPALIKCQVGKGQAILSGVHFEYDPYLMRSDGGYLEKVVEKLTQSETERQCLARNVLQCLRVGRKSCSLEL